MAVNWGLFTSAITPYFASGLIASNTADSARYIADIYDISVKTASTPFGNFAGATNKPILFTNLKTAFDLMFGAGQLDVSGSAYTVMAIGFIGYWTGATMMPFPPIPPNILPAIPNACQVVFPGSPNMLSTMLKFALSSVPLIKTPPMSAALLSMALQIHLTTISGLYFGLIPSVTGVIPAPPIPWTGIF